MQAGVDRQRLAGPVGQRRGVQLPLQLQLQRQRACRLDMGLQGIDAILPVQLGHIQGVAAGRLVAVTGLQGADLQRSLAAEGEGLQLQGQVELLQPRQQQLGGRWAVGSIVLRGRSLIGDSQVLHAPVPDVQLPLQQAQPQGGRPCQLQALHLDRQPGVGPDQTLHRAAVGQAAASPFKRQRGSARCRVGQPLLRPAQRMRQSHRGAGPQDDGHRTREHQGQQGAARPYQARQPMRDDSRQPPPPARLWPRSGRAGRWMRGWGVGLVHGQNAKPTLRCRRKRWLSSP